jgi:branched-chain amino acid transport system substrate-binding protein
MEVSLGRRARRHARLAALAVPVALAVAACGSDSSSNSSSSSSSASKGATKSLVVGEDATLTGAGAVYAAIGTKGTKMAIDDVNAAGGVKAGGTTYKLVYKGADDKTDPTAAVQAVQKLINQDGVHYMVGSYGSATTAAYLPVVQNKQDFLTLLAGAAQEDFTDHPNVFRPRITLPQYTTASANWIIKHDKSVALLTDKQHSGEVAETPHLKQLLQAGGVKLSSEQSYTLGDTDFGGQLAAIMRTNPESIYVRGYPTEASLIIKQAREQGFKGTIYSNVGLTAAILKDSNVPAADLKNVVDFYTLLPVDQLNLKIGDAAKTQEFISRFKSKYSTEPTDIAASAYDSVQILAAAIAKAGGADSVPKVITALGALKVSDVPKLVQAYKPQAGGDIFKNHQAYFQVAARKWFGGSKGFAAFQGI